MPPKKKKGLKKKKKGGAKRPEIITDINLPALPSIKNSTLMYAVATSDVQCFSRLVTHYNYDSEIASKDMNGSTVLHIATKKRDADMVNRILQSPGINMIDVRERRSVGGYTAVHIACLENYIDILFILLKAGANPNIKTDSDLGETPMHICCKHGQLACAKLLKEFNASVEIRDAFGHNASFWAHSKQHDDIIRALGLPPPKAATPAEFFQMMIDKNHGVLPVLNKKKDSKKKGKDGDKKKKKK